MSAEHLRVQGFLVRMIYDPVFASVVRAQPDDVLSSLSEPMRQALAAIDPRALRRDRQRNERTLGQLCEELPATARLVENETGSSTRLQSFFGSAEFHQAIEEGRSLVLALSAYVERLLAERTLRSPQLACVLALELACARARRQPADRGDAKADRVRRAQGVEPVEAPVGALQLLQATREGLSPPALGADRETLCAIAIGDEVSVVAIERALHAVLISLPQPRTRSALIAEAALRLDGDRAAATAALDALVADELILTS